MQTLIRVPASKMHLFAEMEILELKNSSAKNAQKINPFHLSIILYAIQSESNAKMGLLKKNINAPNAKMLHLLLYFHMEHVSQARYFAETVILA